MRRHAVLVAGLLMGVGAGLSACATLNEAECKSGDWKTIGYSDGIRGYPESRLADNAKACAAYGVAPNRVDYLAGRAEGLKRYCTPEGGWRAGDNRQDYAGVCNGPGEADFLTAYHLGLEVGTAYGRLADAQSREDEIEMPDGSVRAVHNGNIGLLQSEADSTYAANVAKFVKLFGRYPN